MLNNELNSFIKKIFESSELNRLPEKFKGEKIFAYPIIGIARGDDPIFQKFKEVVGPEHLTPLEMWIESGLEEDLASNLYTISVVFPFVERIRKEGSENQIIKARIKLPAEIYSLARNYANDFKIFVMKQTINFFKERNFNATAGMLSTAYTIIAKGRFYSTWSERHIAFAAGIGTFSLHEALITEAGCNVRLASVITNAPLEITKRKSDEPYGNCLFYANGTCKECISKCPANAITEKGHDKIECNNYRLKVARRMIPRLSTLLKPYLRRINWEDRDDTFPVGCGFCQFGVPCMDKNPIKDM
jgi:epoxyqueuosine reductase